MGGDGGTIANRRDCLRFSQNKKREKVSKEIERAARWNNCALSQETLRQPIVGCQLGRLYNKDKIIEFILNRNTEGAVKVESVDHIKSMKDVRDLHLTAPEPSNSGARGVKVEQSDTLVDRDGLAFICPIVGVDMTGAYKFVFIWTCGCVVSDRAMKELRSNSSLCPLCNAIYDPDDVITLNPEAEEEAELKLKMEDRAARLKLLKKSSRKHKLPCLDSSSADSQPPNNKLQKSVNGVAAGDKKFSKSHQTINQKANFFQDEIKKIQKSSVHQDSSKSQVYKSLFAPKDSGKKTAEASFWSSKTHPYYFG